MYCMHAHIIAHTHTHTHTHTQEEGHTIDQKKADVNLQQLLVEIKTAEVPPVNVKPVDGYVRTSERTRGKSVTKNRRATNNKSTAALYILLVLLLALLLLLLPPSGATPTHHHQNEEAQE